MHSHLVLSHSREKTIYFHMWKLQMSGGKKTQKENNLLILLFFFLTSVTSQWTFICLRCVYIRDQVTMVGVWGGIKKWKFCKQAGCWDLSVVWNWLHSMMSISVFDIFFLISPNQDIWCKVVRHTQLSNICIMYLQLFLP